MTERRQVGAARPGPDAPGVSVIVPARDAEATLPAALASVLAQDYGCAVEVIVADGSETPVTGDLVRRRFPQVRLVANPGREIAAGLNCALGAARHPVIARCDARAVLPAGYLTRAVATVHDRRGLAVVALRGVAAWLHTVTELPAPPATVCADASAEPLPTGVERPAIDILLAMVRGHMEGELA